MDTFTVSITDLKQNTSDIINRVAYEKKEAIIKRHGKVIARLTPEKTETKKNLNEIWNSFAGSIPDFPDVTKFRRNKRHWRTL